MRTVIDIGTNSTLLLIGCIDQQQNVKSIVQRFNVTRLGEGVHKTGELSVKAMNRTIKVLDEYRHEINALGTMPVHLIGTQALRVANNAQEFIKMVKKKAA